MGSPVSARIVAAPTADSPGDGGDQLGEPEGVEHAEHPDVDLGDLGAARGEVGQGERHPFQGAGALPGDPDRGVGGVGGRVEHRAHDRGVPAGVAQLGADRGREVVPPGPAEHAQLTGGADAVQRDSDRGQPARRVQRLGGGVQHRRPGALEQVADLLAGRPGGGDQPGPSRPEVPQPRPGRVGPLGQVAAQLTHQPGDDHRVGVVVLVAGEVLGLPRPGHQQRLHAHQCHPVLRGDPVEHPPPVPGRLTRHHHRGEPGLGRPSQPPADRLGQLPGLAPHRAPGHNTRVRVGHRAHLLVRGQIKRQHRGLPGDDRPQPGQLLVTATITPRQPRATTVGHDILLVRLGLQARTPHQGDVPRLQPLRLLLRPGPAVIGPSVTARSRARPSRHAHGDHAQVIGPSVTARSPDRPSRHARHDQGCVPPATGAGPGRPRLAAGTDSRSSARF